MLGHNIFIVQRIRWAMASAIFLTPASGQRRCPDRPERAGEFGTSGNGRA